MKTTLDSDRYRLGPQHDHLFKVGELHHRARNKAYDRAVRAEAAAEELRYRDEGLILLTSPKEAPVTTKKSRSDLDAEERRTYSGQGILFAVWDDREAAKPGRQTTIDIIANAIEDALDHGHETSEDIARYLTTSAFQHVPDKRVRFNSVLKAGDVVGAQISRKLYNSYNELAQMAEEAEDPKEKAEMRAEARGFAEAVQVVLSPFSSEDPKDPRLVSWEAVDRMTEAFEKEQRLVRKERNGRPQ